MSRYLVHNFICFLIFSRLAPTTTDDDFMTCNDDLTIVMTSVLFESRVCIKMYKHK